MTASDASPGDAAETGSDAGRALSDGCTLCGLPTGESPVAHPAVDGAFCCRGCCSVARRLDDVDAADAAAADTLDDGPSTDDVDGDDAFLAVEGMHCSTCESFLEARATDCEGVRAADASYAADLVRVVYDPDVVDPVSLPDVLGGTGYSASLVEDAGDAEPGATSEETVGRLIVGGFFGMLVMLWYVLFLYPTYLGVDPSTLLIDLNGVAGTYLLGNVWVMSTVVLAYTGYPILRGAYVSLRAGEPNMDLLVSVAAVTAYAYSALALALGHTELYFDVTVVVVLAVSIGGYYEQRIKNRATGRLADLTTERVETARRRTDEGTESVPLDAVAAGEELVVRPGERVPLDGTVVEGGAAVDEALVTGESLPERRTPGDAVVGGAEVTDGALVVRVDDAESNTLDRITRRLWAVQSGRRGVQRLADRLAVIFVPLVVVLAVVATAAHLALGAAPTTALLTGLAVLVVSCPCALGLATPLSVAAGVRAALEKGIVVTDAAVFEAATEADVVAFDKTGTLTTGELTLVERPGASGVRADGGDLGAADGRGLLELAAALEAFADHPLAEAVVAAAPDTDATVADVSTHPGRGVAGTVDGTDVVVGRPDLFEDEGWRVPDALRADFERARAEGHVAALVGCDGEAAGLLAARDEPREGWADVVETLAADRDIVVITGDEGAAADRFRAHDAVGDVFAGVPPEGKGEVVERLRSRGTVAMVGDGSNDAPALAAADVGIALADGTALAVEAADAVVTTGDLTTVPVVFDLTRATRRRIRQNVGWAFCYNAVAVPAAVAGLLTPLVAALAMAASSLLVVGNASRSLLE